MAKKRHGGLGRGLDALIPMAGINRSSREKNNNNNDDNKENAGAEINKASGENLSDRSSEKEFSETSGPALDRENASGQEFSSGGPEQAKNIYNKNSDAGMPDTEALSGQPDRIFSPGQPDEREMSGTDAGGSSAAVNVSGAGGGGPSGPANASGAGGGGSSGSVNASGADWGGSSGPANVSGTDWGGSSGPVNASGAGGGASPGTVNTGGVQMLRLSQVDPNRSQPRRIFEEDALDELADSIRQFGVLQPILVQKKDGRYEIIAGERRWRACRKAGLKEIPAIIREYSDQETLEISLIENIQREDLNPIEEAKAFKSLLDEFGLRQEDLAARVSKSRTAITNSVRLLKLDERVQDMIIQKEISMGHARALIPVEIPEEQFLIAQQIADRHLSVRDVEKLIKKRKASGAALKKKNPGAETDPALELSYREIEERMKQSLGTKVSIRYGRDGKGKMEIDFYSHEDLERIVDLLG